MKTEALPRPPSGESGNVGDGDIYKPSNVANFCNFVKQATMGKGVHFMMADGGFSVDGQENLQEILSKQLYLGQFAVALGIVREGEGQGGRVRGKEGGWCVGNPYVRYFRL